MKEEVSHKEEQNGCLPVIILILTVASIIYCVSILI